MFHQYCNNKDFAMDGLGKFYDLTYKKDKDAFKVMERRIKAAEKRHKQGILSFDEREELKTEARALMFSDEPVHERYMGVLFLLQAYFSSSLELAIRCGYEPQHPTFGEFARYLERTDIPEDLRPLLNEEFPYIPGVIALGDTYWRPK